MLSLQKYFSLPKSIFTKSSPATSPHIASLIWKFILYLTKDFITKWFLNNLFCKIAFLVVSVGEEEGEEIFPVLCYVSVSVYSPGTVPPCCTGLVSQSHINLYTLALVVRDKAAEEDRMVLLYQLDCNKVLDLLEDNVAVSEEQFSDYWGDNNMRCRNISSPVFLFLISTPGEISWLINT